MAVRKRIFIGQEPPTPPPAFYHCDTDAEKPVSGFQEGDLAYALDTNAFYVATTSSTWTALVTGSAGAPDPHVLATGTALGASHTMSGAAVGEVLRALGATTAAFDQLQHTDLGTVTADQHHAQSHVLATTSGLGADHSTSGLTAGQYLRATAATTAAFQTIPSGDLGTGTPDTTTFLRGDRTWTAPPGGAGASATTVETNLGSTAVWRGKFTITDAAITASSKVHVWQAPGPYTNKGTRADEAEMDVLHCYAEPGTGSAVVKWRSVESHNPIHSKPTPYNAFIPVAAVRELVTTPTILGMSVRGKVKGNIKFTYQVFA